MLAGLELSTEQLLTAVKSPSRVRDMSTNRWRRIDYRNLGAEELGAIYESLLELVPGRDGAGAGNLMPAGVLRSGAGCLVGGGYEAGVVGDDDGVHAIAGVEFREDPADVGFDG